MTKKEVRWICDGCGFVGITEGEWLPYGWIHRLKDDKHFHTESCLRESMTEEERAEYEKEIWMA